MINVYWLDISEFPTNDISFYYQVLDMDEKKRFKTFKSIERKKEFLIGRFLLKVLLARWLRVPIKKVSLEKGEFGKLHLKSNKLIHFNLTHSENIIACAISSSIVGIDCEVINSKFLHLATEVFSIQEIEYFNKFTTHREEVFFEIWTRKEAYLKALGTGIHDDLKAVSVPTSNCSNELSLWDFYTKRINNNCLLSLVVTHPTINSEIKCNQLSLKILLQMFNQNNNQSKRGDKFDRKIRNDKKSYW